MTEVQLGSKPMSTLNRARFLLTPMVATIMFFVAIMTGASSASAAEIEPVPAQVVLLTPQDVEALSQEVEGSGGSPLPADTRSLVVQGEAIVPGTDAGAPMPLAASGWGTALKVAQCTAAIGVFIAGNFLLVTKVKKLGGVAKVAKRLVAAKNNEERAKAALAFFGDVAGITGLVKTCG